MLNKKLMMLTIFFACLLAVSAVSAAENATEDIISDVASEDVVSAEDNNQVIEQTENEETICVTDDGTFTELQNKIDKAAEGSTIYLEKDYKYDEGFSKDGIVISKNVTIAGNGHTLDGLSKSRILYVTTTNPQISLKDINFCNGYGDENGGAVYIQRPESSTKKIISLSVQNCNFTDNLAEICGGALYAYGDILYMTVFKCSFINNKVLGWSGAGAIHAPNPYGGDGLTVSYSTFINNTAYDADSGAISCGNGYINNCYFKDNTAASEGGAIESSYGVDIYNSVFINNEAKYGGAVVSRGDTSNIQNCSFSLNKAKQGGAIYTFAGTTIQDSKFTNNIATDKGGAMYFLARTSNIYNSSFTSNAAENGGAIYNVEINPYVGSEVIVNAIECIFKSNKASQNQHVYGVNTIDCTFVIPTVIIDDDINGNYLNSKISAIFLNVDGEVLASKQVTFKVGDKSYTAKTNGNGVATVNVDLGVGTYIVTAVNPVNNEQKQFELTISKASSNILLESSQNNGVTTLTATLTPAAATGNVVFSINGENKNAQIKDGVATLTLSNLSPGDYTATARYDGDNNLNADEKTVSFKVIEVETPTNNTDASTGNATDSNTGSNTEDNSSSSENTTDNNGSIKPDVTIPPLEEPSSDGSVTVNLPTDATGKVTLSINGKSYNFIVENGVANVIIPNLGEGNYPYTITYSGDSKYSSFTSNGTLNKVAPKVDPVIAADNVNAVYSAGTYYTITVYGTDGKPANTVVKITGKISKTLTSNNGIAKFKIDQVPGTYKITITALGKSVTKTITVKHLVTLKTVKVKKSAKKLVLQATLGKVNGKYLKNKKITFKFNGKKYTAKTNKKGVAKVTIKLKVLKKLKVGKKVSYQATYLKDTVKKTVKIKK